MAHQGYVYIEGSVQGDIESALESDLHGGAIPFNKFSHDIRVPSEFGIQKMSPRPLHGPLFIVKDIDVTTPYLYRAFLTSEDLKIRCEWYETINGIETLVHTIKMQGARIISIDALAHDVRDVSYDTYLMTEKVGFSYNVIEWIYEIDSGDASFEFYTHADFEQQKSGALEQSPSRM